MARDSITLPLAVACERSGLSEGELLSNVFQVQCFTRYLPDREPEVAVLVPRSLVTESNAADLRRTQDALDVL